MKFLPLLLLAASAANAASFAVVGLGTETDGSIMCPSSAAALVGMKPTVGLVSRSGIIQISHSQDTAGPMTRSVADAAALLTAIAGVDPEDPATLAARGHIAPDGTRSRARVHRPPQSPATRASRCPWDLQAGCL